MSANRAWMSNKAYYARKKWSDMIVSIKIRYEKRGYQRVEDKGTWLLQKKAAK